MKLMARLEEVTALGQNKTQLVIFTLFFLQIKQDITCQLVSFRSAERQICLAFGQSKASCFPLFLVFMLS